jgi:long-chain acyl-CoA synthetase
MAKSCVKLDQLLRQSADMNPDAEAVVVQGRCITYCELGHAAERLAKSLRRMAFGDGARVALLLENSIEYVIAFFGVLEADLVVVPLDTSLTADALRYILSDCSVHVVIAHSHYRRLLQSIFEGSSEVDFLLCDAPLSFGTAKPNVLVYDQRLNFEQIDLPERSSCGCGADAISVSRGGMLHELAAIFYTSGSTGAPKGVMLSHLNLISNTLATIEYLELTQEDRTLVILPFNYIYGNSLLLTNIACGACLVIDNRFMYPEAVLNTMEEQRCTGFSGVPSNFMILLGKSTFSSRHFPHLRYLTQAGGAMAPAVIKNLIDIVPDKKIFIMYGQTEAAPRITYLPPEKLRQKLGSIGVPLIGVSVKIVDEQQQELPAEATGELAVLGDNVMMGYWRRADEEQEVLRDGMLLTGDLGYVDADGFFFIVGRKKEIIKTGGNRVSVKEVEECLVANENVLEACVVGIPDPLLSEAIQAIVVLKPGTKLSERDLLLHCRRTLADYKVPRRIVYVDELPKQESGKINRRLLKEGLA